MSSSTSSPPDAPTGVGASAAGTGPASSAERFRPGGMSEEEARRYAGAVGMDEGEDGDGTRTRTRAAGATGCAVGAECCSWADPRR